MGNIVCFLTSLITFLFAAISKYVAPAISAALTTSTTLSILKLFKPVIIFKFFFL